MRRLFLYLTLLALVFAPITFLLVPTLDAVDSVPAECMLPNPPLSCAPGGVGPSRSASPECLGPNPPLSCAPGGVGPTGKVPAECLGSNPPPSCAPGGVGPSSTAAPECLLPNPPPSCAPGGVGPSPSASPTPGCKGATLPASCSTKVRVKPKVAVVKLGATCKKIKLKATGPGGALVTCTKVGKKLVWQKTKVKSVVAKPNAKPSVSPKPSPSSTSPQAIEYTLPDEYKKIFSEPGWEQLPKLPNKFIVGHTVNDYFSDKFSSLVDSTLTSIQQSGAGWVAFDNYNTYLSLEPPKIGPFPRAGYENLPYHMRDATDSELVSMIKSAHGKGLKFALFSELNFGGLTKGGYGVTSELLAEEGKYEKRLEELGAAISNNPTPEVTKFWDDWFQTYGDYVVHQADIAQKNGVEILGIGKQQGVATDTANTERWKSLISRVREHYKGILVYVALEGKDFSEAAGFPAWQSLDAIVMTVGNQAPETTGRTVTEVRDAFKVLLSNRYKPIATQFAKKVILLTYFQAATTQEWFESGPSSSGHDFIIQDQLAQAKLYEALFQAVKDLDWVSGVLTWGYYWKDDLTTLMIAGDSAYDKSSNVRNQPASAIIKKWSLGR